MAMAELSDGCRECWQAGVRAEFPPCHLGSLHPSTPLCNFFFFFFCQITESVSSTTFLFPHLLTSPACHFISYLCTHISPYRLPLAISQSPALVHTLAHTHTHTHTHTQFSEWETGSSRQSSLSFHTLPWATRSCQGVRFHIYCTGSLLHSEQSHHLHHSPLTVEVCNTDELTQTHRKCLSPFINALAIYFTKLFLHKVCVMICMNQAQGVWQTKGL